MQIWPGRVWRSGEPFIWLTGGALAVDRNACVRRPTSAGARPLDLAGDLERDGNKVGH